MTIWLHDRYTDSFGLPSSRDKQQALQAEIQVLQLREQEIQAWIGGITHDLRAPLTTIKVALELLEHRPDKSKRYLSIARQACAQSDALIEELLTLYREEEIAIEKSLSNGNHLQVIFDRLFQSFRVRSSHLNLRLQWDVPQEIDVASSPAGLSLERILTELLNNACKYTKVGGQIGLAVTIADGLQIKIKNQAEIDSEALPHVFNRFYRAPPPDRNDTNSPLKPGVSEMPSPIPGTGLGLSLVRQLTAQLGGTLDLESSDGWTTFTLLLPL